MKDYEELQKGAFTIIDKVSEESDQISEKIMQYRVLTHMKKEIDAEMAKLKPVLMKEEVNEFFIEDKEKVYIKEGAMQSVISPIKVYDKMVELNRGREFFSVCKVSATDLNKIDGGKSLVTEFKENTTRKAGSLTVAKMTQKDFEEAVAKVD